MKHASYLKHLHFDKKLATSIQAKYLANPRLLILLLTIIVTFGIFSYRSIPRRLNPEIKIPYVVVSTVLPGANPADVESLVTDPLEDEIGGVPNVKTFTSTSRDSVSIIQIEFNSGTDADKAASDTKTAVDSVTLSTDAQKPNTTKVDFEQFPVWSFSLTSKTGDVASLITLSKTLRDRLEAISTVDQVRTSGLEEQEIQIILKPEAISTYGFNPQTLIGVLSNASKSFPAGTLKTDSSSFTLSIDPALTNIDDIRNIKVNTGSAIVNLSDIATVSKRSKPSQLQSFVADHKEPAGQAVSFSIYKTENANISATAEDAKEVADEVLGLYDGQFSIFTTSDVSKEIDDQFNELIRDFILTITLVFIALFIFLGIRQAVVASISIPLTFLITFGIMNFFGVALSFISFFSLLLALGLLVDDTIVVISAMTTYHRSGKFTPQETGLLVWRDFIIPIFTTTLTTVWAFIPLLLSGGIIGEFIKPIPIVVSATLIASFFVAMFITLPVIAYLLKPRAPKRVIVLLGVLFILGLAGALIAISGRTPLLLIEFLIFGLFLFLLFKLRNITFNGFDNRISKPSRKYRKYFDQGLISFEVVSIRYQALITKILSSKRWLKTTVIIVVIFSIFSYLLVPLGFVKNEFFPKTDSNQLSVSVELPPGTNVGVSKKEALTIFSKLQKQDDVETVSLNLGQAPDEFGGAGGAEENSFLFTLVFEEDKERSSFEIAQDLRKQFSDYSKGKFSVNEASGGPPAGADVQIKLLGNDLALLDKYADEVVDYLESKPGAANVNKSIKPGTSKITFIPDKQKLAENSISSDQIGLTLRTYASGLELSSVKFDTESSDEEDISLRFSEGTQFVENVDELLITNPTIGEQIPLTFLGRLELATSPTLITREDAKRTISITSSVKQGYGVQDVNKELEQYANTLDLPSGYSWKTGGVNEENQDSINSILTAMVLSFLLILVTMVLQFSSFRKAFIVLLVIPLSISGVFIIFALTNTPLSFPALIGVLALFGIVVKNSILIVDKIQANEKTKMGFIEGIAEGAASRLEAIALTSLTAILGLTPITLSDPLWRGLGGAIIAGLTFSGTIMLFFIPVVYYLIFRSSQTRKKLS